MYGGIAVSRNLLCLTSTDARGRVFLFDLEERRPLEFWHYGDAEEGYADAAGVAVDDTFTIYVADARNDRLRRFTAFGKELPSFGEPHQRPPGSVGRDRRGSLSRPHDVAVAFGQVYVACGDQHLRRGVQRFSTHGEVLPPLYAFGDAESEFGGPRGIYAGSEGIFVADTLNGVVQRFTAAGRFVQEIATARRSGGMSRPIAVLPSGEKGILVVDEGDQQGCFHLDFSGRLRGEIPGLVDPLALAQDDQGRIYVLHHSGERVLRLHPDLSEDRAILDLREYLGNG